MTELERPDRLHLEAAEGWLGLGDLVSASDELERIAPALRAHPDVLLVRCEIYSTAKKWDYVVTVAETLVKIAPKERQGWIHRSFALHEMKRTQEAFDKLLPAAKLFPKFWLVPYNLACYSAQLGHFKDAWQWLENAFEIADTLGDSDKARLTALDDKDLEPFWAKIGEIRRASPASHGSCSASFDSLKMQDGKINKSG